MRKGMPKFFAFLLAALAFSVTLAGVAWADSAPSPVSDDGTGFDIYLSKTGEDGDYECLNGDKSLDTKKYTPSKFDFSGKQEEKKNWLFQQIYGADIAYTYQVRLDPKAKGYTKVVFTDYILSDMVLVPNDASQDLSVEEPFVFTVTPENDTHELYFEITVPKGDDGGEETFYVSVCLWPTLDYDQAFGTPTEDIRTRTIPYLENQFYEKEISYERPAPLNSYKQKCYRTFLYDPELGANSGDTEHPIVFSTRPGTEEDGITGARIRFTAQETGMFSFDYMVHSDRPPTKTAYMQAFRNGHAYGDELVFTETAAKHPDGNIAWTSVNVALQKGEELAISFYCADEQAPGTGMYAAISNVSFNTQQKTVTVTATGDRDAGTVTVNGSAPREDNRYNVGAKLVLSAKPAEQGVFIGWFDQAGSLLTNEAEYTTIVKEDVSYSAKFLDRGENIVLVGDTLKSSLETALAEAGSGDVVRLLVDAEVNGTLTVPSGVTLLIPHSQTDVGYNPRNEEFPSAGVTARPNTGAIGTKYRTLTITESGVLNVQGTLVVDAVVGRPQGGWYDQDVTGGYGEIANNGRIVVNEGGWIDCPGFIGTTGNGTVEVKSGGTVVDLYVVRHWRGGSQASAMYFKKVYPMNEYDCQNITCPITINKGATYSGLVRMYALSGYYATRFPQVDDANGLIRLTSDTSYVVKRNGTGEGARETYEIHNGADFSRSTLEIVGMDLSTGDYVYPWNGVYDFKLIGGSYTFSEDFKFMPGVTMTAEGANLTVADGKTVVFYEPFGDADHFGAGSVTANTGYPADRTAATLSLDETSSLTNRGTFAGTLKAPAGSIRTTRAATWSTETFEANGYYTQLEIGDEIRAIGHEAKIECTTPEHAYAIEDGTLRLDGTTVTPIDQPSGGSSQPSLPEIPADPEPPAEDPEDLDVNYTTAPDVSELAPEAQDIVAAAEEGRDNLNTDNNSLLISAEVTNPTSVTWTVTLDETAREAPAMAVGNDVIGSFLRSMAANRAAAQRISTLTGIAPEVEIRVRGTVSPADIARILSKLGFDAADVAGLKGASEAAALAAEGEAAGDDLVGESCSLLVTSPTGNEVTFTFTFAARTRSVDLFRLYNPNSGAHLLTADANEYETLRSLGWRGEGAKATQPTAGSKSAGVEVFRLYNKSNGDHHYTADANEYEELQKAGWIGEGAKFRSATEGGSPVYRLWNTQHTENGGAGSHLWTADANEYEELPTAEPAGAWRQEDISWYALSIPEAA